MILTKDCYACSKVLCKVRISYKLSGQNNISKTILKDETSIKT